MSRGRRVRLTACVGVALTLLAFGLPGQIAVAATQAEPISYVYDELGRIRAVIDPTGGAATYSYDGVGNLLSIGRPSLSTTSIIEFDPKSGPSGTAVTISGTGFSPTAGQNTVTFNGSAATISSATATQIVAVVPSGATSGTIGVSTPNGSAASAGPFTVAASKAPSITGFAPDVGVPGDAVSISGSGFQTPLADNVTAFNITRAQIASATASSLSALVPPGTSGRITVATPYGKAVSSADFFIPPPGFAASDVGFTGRMAVGCRPPETRDPLSPVSPETRDHPLARN